jgi:hypothetical protein
MIWSIDPGETTGMAMWSEEGNLSHKEKMPAELFVDFLSESRGVVRPSVIVVEQWAFDPGKTQRGNKMVSSQVIGAVKLYAKQVGAEVILQDRRILKVSALHTGTPIPKNGHFDDDVSAYLHGHYYFVVSGILKPPNQVH